MIIWLGLLGVAFGSFINALVWRVHQQTKSKKYDKKLSILHGRSMCPNCKHELKAKDLVPIISWLTLRGKCRYCKVPISIQYPLVEAVTAAVFLLTYVYWPMSPNEPGRLLLMSTALLSLVGLIALSVYDLKWMLLPNRILYPTLLIAVFGRLAYIVFISDHKLSMFLQLVGSILIASGIFWLLFEVSKGKWIGFGDVRLGLITGTLLATPSLSLLMLFLASVIGTMISIPLMVIKKRGLDLKIPFGPYLILSTWLCILFGVHIISWYKHLLVP